MKKTLKQIKLERTRLRLTQNPSVNDVKLTKKRQVLRAEYLGRIKNNQV